MADVRKTVEIALSVVGVDPAKIKNIATLFENVQKTVTKATESVQGFQKALDSIKPPTSLTSLITALKQLDQIKVPNLNSIANGFDKLGKMQVPPDISNFARELQKLSGIKLPGIASLVSGFNKLIALDVNGVINKIRSLNTALSELDKRGGVSAFKNFASDVSQMRTAFASADKSMRSMSNSMKESGEQADRSGLRIRSFADKIRTVLQFRGISEAFMFVKDAIRNGVTAIVEYDQALKDLQAITGATTLEVAQMGIKILEVASTTKFSASEVAQGMRTIGQAGFSASEAVQTMQAVSDLATGTLSDMSTTVDLVTTAMRVFRIDASESASVADVFANAVNRSKLTIDKLRTAMNYVGPIARDSGVSFKELAASMGTLANSGLRASTIGTGLRRVFAELIDPSKKLKEAARNAGVALSELDPRTSSLADVMQNLNLVVGDAQVAFDVFGKRGASAVLALSSTESNFKGMLETVGRSGTAAQQAAIQMEGLGVSFKNLKDKIGIFAIALGNAGIADAMKVVIDIARNLIDIFTAVVDTALGKFIVSLGIAVTAGYALATAIGVLNIALKTTLFQSIIASAASFTAVLTGATGALATFTAALGPIGIGLLALSGLLLILSDTAQTTSQEFFKMADNFGTLSKKLLDYEVKVSSLQNSTTELKDANISLRNQLLEVASGYTEISKFAAKAAASINPLNGEFTDGKKALEDYNDELDRLQYSNLVKAGNQVNNAIANQNGIMSRIVNEAKADWNQWNYLFTSDFVGFGKRAEEARDFAAEIASGSVNMKELSDYVAKLDHTRLNAQQKQIIESYKLVNEQADKFVKYVIESNKIGLDDTIESIQKVAEEAGLSGIALSAVIEQIKLLKESSVGSFENIIEKWSVDGVNSVKDFIGEYQKLGGVFGKGEQAQIAENTLRRQALVEELEGLKVRQKAEEEAGVALEKTWKDYYAGERILLKKAYDLKKELAENGAAQNILVLIQEQKDLDKSLGEIAVKYKDNARLRVKYQEEATREYIVKEQKLLEGVSIDYSDQKDDYEAHLTKMQNLNSKYIDDLADQEARGVIEAEEANNLKLYSTLTLYRDMLVEAKKYQAQVTKEENKAEYEKRNEVVLKAEEAFYKQRAKYVNTYNTEITKSSKEITKTNEKVAEENQKNSDKVVDIARKNKEKLESLASDYKDKRISIEEALASKIKDINEDIQDNRKETISDVLSLEIDSEEKIRGVKKGSLTDEQKNTSDRVAALKYLKEGRILLGEAEKEKDEEKLERGLKLIKMSESLATGLDRESDSVQILKATLESLKNARNIKGELKELDLIKKKNEEITEAESKSAKQKAIYDEKVKAATVANDLIASVELKRHNKEMENLNKEISKYEEKIRVATGNLSSTPLYFDNIDYSKIIVQENARHSAEMNNIVDETKAINDKYEGATTAVGKYLQAYKEVQDEYNSLFGQIDALSKDVQLTLESLSQTPAKVDIDNADVIETKSMLDSIKETVLDVIAKVIGYSDIIELQKAIDSLKDKTITITKRYVTQGEAAFNSVMSLATGGRLPGFGGGDRRQILGEDGEWMINKWAVRKYGDDFFAKLNNMTLPKFQNGGRISAPTANRIPAGGSMYKGLGGLGDFGKVILDTGKIKLPVLAHRNVVSELNRHLRKSSLMGVNQ